MKRIWIILAALLLTTTWSCTLMNSEERAIRSVFSNLKSAIKKNRDTRFLNLIDEETKDYFKRIQKTAIYAAPEQLKDFFKNTNTPNIDKLHVFSIRTVFKNKNLDNYSFENFLGLLLDYGLFREIKHVKITSVEMKNEGIAIAHILTKLDQKTSLEGQLLFVQEDGVWKIDMTSRFPQGDRIIKKFCEYKDVIIESELCIKAYAKHFGGFEIDEQLNWTPLKTN